MYLLLTSSPFWELSFETCSGKAYFACPVLLPILSIFRNPSKTERSFGSFEPSLLFYCIVFCCHWKCRIVLPRQSVRDSLLLLCFMTKMNQSGAGGNWTLSVLCINKILVLMANPKFTSHPSFRTRGRFCGKSKGIPEPLHIFPLSTASICH